MRKKAIFTAVALSMCALSAVADAAVDPAMLKARQKFFGIENVDVNTGAVKKDKVITSWVTNTTYATSIAGHVILLDSYITMPQLPSAPIDKRYSPFLPKDLADLKPEAIFVGHGHGDHADNAAYIAAWSGATIYGSAELCTAMAADITKMATDPNPQNGGAPVIPPGSTANCVAVVPAGTRPGEYNEGPNAGTNKAGVRKITTPLDSIACVLAFKHIHSGAGPLDTSFPHTTLNDIADPRYFGRTFTTPAQDYPAMYLTTTTGTTYIPPTNVANRVAGQLDTRTTGTGGGGSIVIYYQFILKGGYNFTLAWVNSSGPAKEGIGADPGLISLATYNNPATPQATKDLAAAIGNAQYALMDTLPNVDVLNGSIVSLGATVNQQRDIISVIQHLKPKVYVPGHITDVAQKGSGIYHMISWRETALNMGFPQSEWPEFKLQLDPIDFAQPTVYTISDPRWANPAKAARYAQFCN